MITQYKYTMMTMHAVTVQMINVLLLAISMQ